MRASRQIWNIPLKGGMLERYHDGEGLEDAHKWCLIMGGGRSSVAMKQSIASVRRIIYQKADKKFIYLIITMHQQFWTMSRIKYPLLFTNAWLLFRPYMNIFGPSYIRWPYLGSQVFLLSLDLETSFACQIFSLKEESCLVKGILFK